jgi:hypothetical protein
MVRCQRLGHGFRFNSDGPAMRWTCEGDGGAGGEQRNPSAADAARLACAFDREDWQDLGSRAPLGLLPLRLIRAIVHRRRK